MLHTTQKTLFPGALRFICLRLCAYKNLPHEAKSFFTRKIKPFSLIKQLEEKKNQFEIVDDETTHPRSLCSASIQPSTTTTRTAVGSPKVCFRVLYLQDTCSNLKTKKNRTLGRCCLRRSCRPRLRHARQWGLLGYAVPRDPLVRRQELLRVPVHHRQPY
jgi:hypothetical protein